MFRKDNYKSAKPSATETTMVASLYPPSSASIGQGQALAGGTADRQGGPLAKKNS